MRLLRLQATNTPKMKLHFLREAITRGYSATSAETIVGITEEIIGRAVQLREKAALAAARAELRETIDAASSAEGQFREILRRTFRGNSGSRSSAFGRKLAVLRYLFSGRGHSYLNKRACENARKRFKCTCNCGRRACYREVEQGAGRCGYRVLYNDGEWHSGDVGDVESCLIKELTNGQTYKLAVQYIESGNYFASSAEVSATPEELIAVRLNVKPNEG